MQIYDIWVGLTQDKQTLVFAFIWIAWGMVILFAVMRKTWSDEVSYLECLSLALGGWVLPVFSLSLLTLALGIFLNIRFNLVALLILVFLSGGFAIRTIRRDYQPSIINFLLILFSIAILLFLVLLRIPFLTRISLPPYFDSAEHYRIADILIKDYEHLGLAGNFIWPVSSYYHLGYHVIVAGMTATSHGNLDRVILVLGQIILAFAPIPLFFIVWRETKSFLAGLFAVILGALGWYMPAHAVNWGKYPALLSLLCSQFSLNILHLFSESKGRPAKHGVFVGLIILSILTSFLIHIRSVILIGIGVISWKLAQGWDKQSKSVSILFLGLTLVGITGEIFWIERSDVLNSLLDPYLQDGVWITITVSLLSIFAYSKHRQLVFACLLFILLLISSLFIPVSTNTFFTLMDRPSIEMSLFIPLSILGGLGFASMIQLSFLQSKSLKVALTSLLLGLISFHAFMKYDFYPSDCCQIVSSDDLVALDWMDKNLPADARILIPSGEIKIASSGESPQNAGSDAGVWIVPLINRPTISQPYNLDFEGMDTLKNICSQGITHIYMGSTDQSFSSELIGQKPDWYEIMLFLPSAKVYRVLNCA